LFSFNVGLLARWDMAQANYAWTELRLKDWINLRLHLHPHSDIGGDAAFLLLALEIAVVTLLGLRLLSKTGLSESTLFMAGGTIAFLALPASWFYRAHLYRPLPGLPDPPHIILFFEVVAATVCAHVFPRIKWPLSGWLHTAVVILHFALWGWLFLGGPYFWLAPFQSIFPLAGLCSCLPWVLYAARRGAGKVPQLVNT
jgi:hypothetical protein